MTKEEKLARLNTQREALEKRLKQLKARESAITARERAAERKAENQLKYILGGAALAEMAKNPEAKASILGLFKGKKLRPQDQAALARFFPSDFKAPK